VSELAASVGKILLALCPMVSYGVSMGTHISQRQAREYRAKWMRLSKEIDDQRRSWVRDWPGSTTIHTLTVDSVTAAKVETARRLKHAVVVTSRGSDLVFWATEIAR
jgi:hypothetical protein